MTFEEAQKELERIVQQLEAGRPTWTRRSRSGSEARSSRLCSDKLDSAQGKIEELARRVEAVRPGEPA